MKRFLILVSTGISIIISIGTTLALNIPKQQGYVLDQASVLTVDQENKLENKIYKARQDTNIEIGILIINSLSGEDIFNYSLAVAEARGIGDKEKDNGLLMLFAMDDRERRIQVGYGLEGIITDNIAKRFGERNITPNFRAGLYFDGINNTLQDIIDYIEQDLTALAYINSENNSENTNNNQSSGGFDFAYLIIAFVLAKIFIIKYDPKKKKSKITKKGRINFAILGTIASVIIYQFFLPGEILGSTSVGYGGLLGIIGILALMGSSGGMEGGNSSFRGSSSGGFSSRSSSSGSSFGGFGGGSFGGGGGGGKR